MPIERYCSKLLTRDDVAENVKEGAREILAQQMLLRPAARDSAMEHRELLRATSATDVTTDPSELLRASDALQRTPPKQVPGKSRLGKFWHKVIT